MLEYFSVVFLDLSRGHERIKLPAVKTFFVHTIFTVQLQPKLFKLFFGVAYFELGWGQPRLVSTAAL